MEEGTSGAAPPLARHRRSKSRNGYDFYREQVYVNQGFEAVDSGDEDHQAVQNLEDVRRALKHAQTLRFKRKSRTKLNRSVSADMPAEPEADYEEEEEVGLPSQRVRERLKGLSERRRLRIQRRATMGDTASQSLHR